MMTCQEFYVQLCEFWVRQLVQRMPEFRREYLSVSQGREDVEDTQACMADTELSKYAKNKVWKEMLSREIANLDDPDAEIIWKAFNDCSVALVYDMECIVRMDDWSGWEIIQEYAVSAMIKVLRSVSTSQKDGLGLTDVLVELLRERIFAFHRDFFSEFDGDSQRRDREMRLIQPEFMYQCLAAR